MPLRQLTVAAIGAYQQHLSPRKGFHCAHRALYGGESCSAYVKRMVQEDGLWRAAGAARQRFAECRAAALVLRASRDQDDSNAEASRRRRGGDGADGVLWCCDSVPSEAACLACDALPAAADCLAGLDCSAIHCGACL